MSKDKKVALVTGITGQDGSYLTDLLLEKGYTVHGIIRSSAGKYKEHPEYGKRIHLHYGDLTDATTNLITTISKIRPTEIYNLGAMSHVKVSFDRPQHTVDANALGVLRMLEAVRACGLEKTVRFYQASSSELFGKAQEVPQKETTAFYPRSPYGGTCQQITSSLYSTIYNILYILYKFYVYLNVFKYNMYCIVFSMLFFYFFIDFIDFIGLGWCLVAKQYAFWTLVNYREAYGMYCCNGILFNHESPRRGIHFVTRKITRAVAHIYYNKQNCLRLGNIDAKRDWGHARDFVEGMWKMLQNDTPTDFILATGENHTVREFVENAFAVVGIHIRWMGPTGTVDEIGVDSNDENRVLVRIDPKYFRPTEVELILGDPTKAKNQLGWTPKTTFQELITEMVGEDLRLLQEQEGLPPFSIPVATTTSTQSKLSLTPQKRDEP